MMATIEEMLSTGTSRGKARLSSQHKRKRKRERKYESASGSRQSAPNDMVGDRDRGGDGGGGIEGQPGGRYGRGPPGRMDEKPFY